MSAHKPGSPLVLLPRELGQVPPPVGTVGVKGRGLCQLLTLKARVPRFGIVTAEAFDQHLKHKEIAAALETAEAASVVDDAMLIGLGEQLARAVLRTPLSTTLRIGLAELRKSFAEDDLFAVRASIVGDLAEAAALAGALDAALGTRSLDETVQRIFALAFHPRTLQARVAAGLPPFGTRIAIIVQRLVNSEQSGICWSLDVDDDIDERRRRPRARLRACPGLAGGIGGTRGNPRIACDTFTVERPAVADEGLSDDARVTTHAVRKPDALRVDGDADKPGTRMFPLDATKAAEACLSPVQARMVAKEALRLEAAFGRPQAVSFAFAGRLLHILDVEPLLVPQTRVESTRRRTWDERLVPAPLSQQPSSTLTFSVWQRGAARGLERAGRILGVRGTVLEEMRPQFRRALGVVTGRITGNVEVFVALLDLLPFADKAREALALTTGQPEIGARKEAPPPGFWRRAKVRIEEGRWTSQLERLSQVADGESARFVADVRALLERLWKVNIVNLDPDTLIDDFDELEEALGKCVAALTLSGIAASLCLVDARAAFAEVGLAEQEGLLNDLLIGEDERGPLLGQSEGLDLLDATRRFFALVRVIDEDPVLREAFHGATGAADVAALDDAVFHSADASFLRLRQLIVGLANGGAPEGCLVLDDPRLSERPERIVRLLLRLVRSPRVQLEARVRDAVGRRKKAEYAIEQAAERLGGLKASSAKKRVHAAVAAARRHARAFAALWIPTERVVAELRRVALALGERLFEHGLLDQPRDVFHLQDTEIAGVIRGTGPDVDVRPLIAARRRQVTARPPSMARRVETRGVVATSLLIDDETVVTSPGDVPELFGVPVVGGVVEDRVCLTDRHPDDVEGVRGVAVVGAPRLGELPLLACAVGVVAERGASLSPACQALRQLGVPTVVEAPAASMVFVDGERAIVDGDRGIARRVERMPAASRPSVPVVDPEQFLREAIATDPTGRPKGRVERPAGLSSELPAPPAAGLHRITVVTPGGVRSGSDERVVDDDSILESDDA